MAVRHQSAEALARLLRKAHKTPTGWKACCPAHDDHNPSLFIADGIDGIAMRCYAGCTYAEIRSALESLGAEFGQPTDFDGIPSEHPTLGAYSSYWDYRDSTGRVVCRIARWDIGSKKELRPISRTSEGWKWKAYATPRPLYNLDMLTNEPERPVLVVEGEKAAAAAARMFPKVVATTWAGGAQSVGQADWSPLVGRHVTLVPDCDKPGTQAMQWVANALRDKAASIRVVDPRLHVATLPDGWDLADAENEGRDVCDWFESVEPQVKPSRFKWLHELVTNPSAPRWLIPDVLEHGVIALLTGPRGTYKSFIAMHWAMQLVRQGIAVAVISAEGAGFGRRAKAWLLTHAPDVDANEPPAMPMLVCEQRVNFNDPETIRAVVAEIEAASFRPQLIIIDTLSKNSGGLDENSNSEVKAFIGYLDEYLRRHFDATVLLPHHTGHNEKGRARGASALEADTDAAYVITRNGTEKLVTVSRERFKDSGDLPPLTYEAHVIEVGGFDSQGRPITSIALKELNAHDVPPAPKQQPRSGPQKQVLRILRDLQANATEAGHGALVWTVVDVRDIAKGAGLAKTTAREVAAALCQFYLVPTVGGYRLDVEGQK